MISYTPFYESMERKNITEYQLIHKHGISSNTLHRMKRGEDISTKTLDTLCRALGCTVEDILAYDSEGEGQTPPENPGEFCCK